MPQNLCPYCGGEAVVILGASLYPAYKKLSASKYYVCIPCGAWVGTHKETGVPLGTLANKGLRTLRIECHALFDKFRTLNAFSRSQAYRWLANALSISKGQTHFAMFTVEQCEKAKELLNKVIDKGGRI